ncbi:unnamed protein product [Rhizophagus irregularis]|nr:unnamed protein product [Rhizophagus irregularis]
MISSFSFISALEGIAGQNEPEKEVTARTNQTLRASDVGLDTNWTLRTPAWTIRREIRLLVLQGVSFFGFGTWASGPFGDGN